LALQLPGAKLLALFSGLMLVVGSLVGQSASAHLASHKSPLHSVFAGLVIAIGVFTIYKGLP
jgi:hypothetical protein